MNRVLELFGEATPRTSVDPDEFRAGSFGQSVPSNLQRWNQRIQDQHCPFIRRRCYKVRKSDPTISIGTCAVSYGKESRPILICPARLLERNQVFTDCLHLLTTHEPGNELHVVPEVSIPGGSVDYFLVSARMKKVVDFVGIELQALDTTGTIWPERQRMLRKIGVPQDDDSELSTKNFGMNWKMTAKTTLVQMHHKIRTFEYVNKKLVLVMQDCLSEYMHRHFNFSHLSSPAKIGDPMHFHSYGVRIQEFGSMSISLDDRKSTDSDGISACLGLKATTRLELEQIVKSLEKRISNETILTPVSI